ncbi:hypothetical protein CTI12_AA517700 [Artemisia annua]|uniref:Uncharacterized protein n=1 Tax=Artemisia annua TaxID=35608 RepID=A0A2U1L8Y9_ARTAN|nr:hypothetical protein CTI12_AA517700 [Artemisia annua]
MCPSEPLVLSGGKDKSVVLWSIHDHISTLATQPGITKSGGSDDNQLRALLFKQDVYSMGMRILLKTFNSVPLADKSSAVLVMILVLSYGMQGQVEKAHNADLHCVDWNPIDENLIVTGSADNTIRLFDRRNLTTNGIGSPIHIFENHTAAVLCVQWSPDKSSVFGSSAEDGILNIWDHNKIGESSGNANTSTECLSAGLRNQHRLAYSQLGFAAGQRQRPVPPIAESKSITPGPSPVGSLSTKKGELLRGLLLVATPPLPLRRSLKLQRNRSFFLKNNSAKP